MINVIGLGARDKDISQRGKELIEQAKHVVLKTAKVDAAKQFSSQFPSMDDLFESCETFDELNEKIAQRLLSLEGDVCYLVPYTPEQDTSVSVLMRRANVNLIRGVPHELPLDCNCLLLSAYHLPNVDTFCADKSLPLLVYDVDCFETASAVKLFLGEIFGDEETCFFGDKQIFVYEIDRQKKYSYDGVVTVYPTSVEKRKAFSYYDLIAILKRLRQPDGCQWDRAQTHESLKKNLLEEAQELIEAIDKLDLDNMAEECGDVLLQPLFHAAIASEENEFTYRDILNKLCNKLIFRHSHVFGEDKVSTPEEALALWKKNKQKEKKK